MRDQFTEEYYIVPTLWITVIVACWLNSNCLNINNTI